MGINDNKAIMEQFPTLETQRLVLRKLKLEDLDRLVFIANNKRIADQITNMVHPYNHVHASMRLGYVSRGFNEGSRYCFAIIEKDRDRMVGEISLHNRDGRTAELGYWIDEGSWGLGFASEACKVIIGFGFSEIGYSSLFATCSIHNPASEKVLLKNGFQLESEQGQLRTYSLDKQ